MDRSCSMLHYLKSLFGTSNSSAWQDAILDAEYCGDVNSTSYSHHYNDSDVGDEDDQQYGVIFYAFITPIIICVGVLGNLISLRVFFSRNLRKLSATVYLVAISISDLMVLLIYVLLDWLRKGLPHFPTAHNLGWIINTPGICETFLYFSYLFRFVSVWLIVVFTVERYIAACRPLHRRVICTKSFGRRAITGVTLLGGLISLYKPIISGVHTTSDPSLQATFNNNDVAEADVLGYSRNVCSYNPEYETANFIMEVAYGLSITAVPFVVIAFFNALILKSLMLRESRIKQGKICLKRSSMRWEFTVMLLVVSTTFICLNLPYFVYWCQRNLLSTSRTQADDIKNVNTRDQFYVTLTIYYMNYCINFFLYCLTGTYYRKALKTVFCCYKEPPGLYTRGSMASFSSQSTARTSIHETSRLYSLSVPNAKDKSRL